MTSAYSVAAHTTAGRDIDLPALLSEPARAGDVALDLVPQLLDVLAAHEGRCRLVRDLLTVRLATTPPRPSHCEVDELIDDIHEVARIARRSVSWLRKHGRTLPGFHQPGGKGCKVAWSRQALLTWAANSAS